MSDIGLIRWTFLVPLAVAVGLAFSAMVAFGL